MKTTLLLLIIAVQISAFQNSDPDFSFLFKYPPKERIQKIIDTTDYINNKDPRKALEYIDYGFGLLKKYPDPVQERDLYYVQAWAYLELSDYKKATSLAEKSFQSNTNPEDDVFLVNYYTLTANIAMNLTDYSRAIDYYFKSLKLVEKRGEKRNLGVAYGSIGNVYSSLDFFDEGLEYYNKSMKYFYEVKDTASIAIVHDNMGLLLTAQGKYSDALKHFWAANKLYKAVNNIINYYWNFAYIGDAYLNLGDTKKAQKYLTEGYNGSKKYGHYLGEIEALVNLGKLFFRENNYDKALQILKETEPKVIRENNYQFLASIYKMESEIYKVRGNYKNAYDYFLKYSECADSLNSAEVQKKIKETELKYNIEKKENELIILRNKKRLDELEIKRANTTRNYLIVIFIISTLFFVVLIFNKSRSVKKLKEKQNIINEQNDLLEIANKELIESQTQLQDLNRDLAEKVTEEVKKREAQHLLLMQKSKLESLGIFSAGVAHEINQPLTSISFSIENMIYKKQTDSLTNGYLKDKFDSIVEDIKRITNIINHIRIFSREQSNFKIDKFDLNEVINNSLMIVSARLRNKNISVDLDLNKLPLIVMGNKYQLEQVLLNLIVNSQYAVEKKEELATDFHYQKKIKIKTYREENENCFCVEDNGIGIPEDKIPQVFEPFFTTKEPEDGTGLGLSIVYGIVKDTNGSIFVHSEEGKFTSFTIKIPSIN